MENIDNIALYLYGIYLLPNEFTGYGNYLFHAVVALDVVIGASYHDSLQVNYMNKVMEMYKYDPFLLSYFYRSNRPGQMRNV